MRTHLSRKMALAVLGVVGVGLCCAPADAASSLWISAPGWSYSAAAAASPAGTAYFWGLSVGAGTYSWAYAFSNDGLGDAAFAFAEASAGRLGGMGGVQVAGIADPYAGVGIDISLTDPSNPGGYPTSKPGTDPFSLAYTITATGITFNSGSSSGGSELNGTDELEAFVYNGSSLDSALQSELGASSDRGSSQAGDVTDLATLVTDLGLTPLDAPISDPGSLTKLSFTENTGDLNSSVNPSNVILVGIADAASVPTPEALPVGLALLGLGGAVSLLRKRRIA